VGCRYDDVKTACVTRLVYALRNDTVERATWAKLCEIIYGNFKGDPERVADVLSLVWRIANKDDDTPAIPTSNDTSSVRPFFAHLRTSANFNCSDSPRTSTVPRVGTRFRPQW
jgi:hypothetical protein